MFVAIKVIIAVLVGFKAGDFWCRAEDSLAEALLVWITVAFGVYMIFGMLGLNG